MAYEKTDLAFPAFTSSETRHLRVFKGTIVEGCFHSGNPLTLRQLLARPVIGIDEVELNFLSSHLYGYEAVYLDRNSDGC
jgi:hypothetical protein